MANTWSPATKRRLVFAYSIVVFVGLLVVAFTYFADASLMHWVPGPLRGLPVGTAWFGALGGVAISLKGVYDHPPVDPKTNKDNWSEQWPLWYVGRPFSGLLAGIVTYALLRAVYPHGKPAEWLVLGAAFILGTQESEFFAFLHQVGAVIVAVPKKGSKDSNTSG